MPNSNLPIRKAEAADVEHMVALSRIKREEYSAYEPVFWRIAPDADASQTPYFAAELANPNKIVLVWDDGEIKGFAIAAIVPAPPVYAPGGLTCLIDDFCVAHAEGWETIARPLLAAIGKEAKSRGAVQMVIVCGHLDQPKRAMLAGIGCSLASEWYVFGLV